VMVTHSPDCATYAERILKVSDGRLIDTQGAGRTNREKRKSSAIERGLRSNLQELSPAINAGICR